jgi:hypothetical protein
MANHGGSLNRTVTHALGGGHTFRNGMSGIAPTAWPADPDHREAIDTLLVMAEAEDRWGEQHRAVDLLDNVERIVGSLPKPYERLRCRCRDAAALGRGRAARD